MDPKKKLLGKGLGAKADKKAGKKGKQAQDQEEKVEETALSAEKKQAINTERAIFRYRFTVLKNYTLNKLNGMQTIAKALYNKLDDWIYYTFKVENDAVGELSKQLKGFIEAEKKM